MEVNFNADDFYEAMAFWYQQSKKTLAEQMHVEVKGIVRNMIDITPPGDFSAKGLAAKRQGEGAVKRDLNKLFAPIPAAEKYPQTTYVPAGVMPKLHKRHRNRRGRVTGRRNYPVKPKDFNDYQRETIRKVGKLAAGWNRSAGRFGYRPPAWIWRHKSPGSVRVTVTDKYMRFTMINKVRYASEQPDIERRIQYAINMQRNALISRINNRWKESSPFR